jgi:hypothetical protein
MAALKNSWRWALKAITDFRAPLFQAGMECQAVHSRQMAVQIAGVAFRVILHQKTYLVPQQLNREG